MTDDTTLAQFDDPRLEPSRAIAVSRAIVEGVVVTDEATRRARQRILSFIDEHPDALHRTCLEGHLTGSALVVEEGTGRLLFLFHRKLQRWLQPGGHADGDANLAAVALREATEETGITTLAIDPTPIDLDVHRVEPPGEAPHDHLDVRFLVVAPLGSTPVANQESEGLRWVEPSRLDTLGVDDGTIRLARAGLARMASMERSLRRPRSSCTPPSR